MRFVLTSFETGADVKFEIPDADLKRHPDTMLSAYAARWAGPAGTPDSRPEVQLKAVKTAETYWSDGMEAFVKTYYARASGDQAIVLPASVELEDAVAVAEWLSLPLGDLSEITYELGTENGALARKLRAKLYIKLRENQARTMVAVTESMEKTPKQKYRFVFLKREDDGEYSYLKKKEPFDRFLPVTELTHEFDPHWGNELPKRQPLSMEQVARFGTKESAYEWAQCEAMRDETVRELEGHGFEASWKTERVEVSGADAAESDYWGPRSWDAVHGPRLVLTVTLPAAEPAAKRRRV